MFQDAKKQAAGWVLAIIIAAEAALAAAAVLFLLVEGQPRTALAALAAALFLALAGLLATRFGRRHDRQPPIATSPSSASPQSLAGEAIRRHPVAAVAAATCAGLLLARNPELCRRLFDFGELMLRDRLGDSRTDTGAHPAGRSEH